MTNQIPYETHCSLVAELKVLLKKRYPEMTVDPRITISIGRGFYTNATGYYKATVTYPVSFDSLWDRQKTGDASSWRCYRDWRA